jgi:hypothetical protein
MRPVLTALLVWSLQALSTVHQLASAQLVASDAATLAVNERASTIDKRVAEPPIQFYNDFGAPQAMDVSYLEAIIKQHMLDTEDYFHEVVLIEPAYEHARQSCRNRFEMCTIWALLGEVSASASHGRCSNR